MKMKLQHFIIGILLSFPSFADGYYPEPASEDLPWSVTASIGNGKYPHFVTKDSKSTFGRLAVGNQMMLTGDFAWGLELGVQNSNKVHINIPNETLAVLEWLPVKTTLGSMLDLLITAKSDPLAGSAFFAQLKGGFAYRYWKMERHTINDLSKLTGEIQAGFGYPITTLTNLNLLYQGVFGGDPNFRFDTFVKTGHLSNIPTLHAVLLGLSVNI